MHRAPTALIAIAGLVALAGCAASDSLNHVDSDIAYRNVMIGSATAEGFYFVPADQWTASGADNAARRQAVMQANEGGPIKANTAALGSKHT